MIADWVPGCPSELSVPGAVCHRLGVGPMQPKGQSWDYGIGVSHYQLGVDFDVCSKDIGRFPNGTVFPK